jgi:hypothetical protein
MSSHLQPSLVTLPQEILDEISCRITARADLSSLSMTSKTLRTATVELLYKDITMTWKAHEDPGHKAGSPRIDFLLRTLLVGQHFAVYFSIANLRTIGYRSGSASRRGNKPQLPAMALSTNHAAAVDQALKRMSVEDSEVEEQLRKGVHNNEFDAVIALLLLLCPKVARLELGLDILIRNNFLSHILRYGLPSQVTTRSSRFQSVKDLRIGTSLEPEEDTLTYHVRFPQRVPEKILNHQAYLPLFYIPTLEHIEMSLPGLAKNQEFRWPTLIPPKLMALTSLCLRECSASPDVLYHILTSTSYITRLEYDCWLFDRQKFNASTLETALSAIKKTLVHLKVSIQFWSNETLQPVERQATWVQGFCSLQHMGALETMVVPLSILSGWEYDSSWNLAGVLPPNIASMSILGDCGFYESWGWEEEQIMSRFQAFVAQGAWRKATPRLRHIEFAHPEWEDMHLFHDLCIQNDLSCEVRDAGYPLVI